jgi:putative flippase GtrA
MASASSRLVTATVRRLPAPVRRKLEGETGKRFLRFVLVAAAAVISSQIALILFLDVAHLTAGISGVLAGMVGAAVSYVLSRWAWERKGRPDLLRETLPFWIVAIAAWIVLGLATKLGVHWAAGMPKHGLKWHLVVNGTYFGANVLTFLARFVVFHYVLFADRGSSAGGAGAGTTTAPVSSAEGLAATVEDSGEDNPATTARPRSPSAG